MTTVEALYRYPVKGMTAEPCQRVTVRGDGTLELDRVLGFVFADDPGEPDRGSWWSPRRFAVLRTAPGLAPLRVSLTAGASRLRITLNEAVLVEDALDAPGRERIAAAVTQYVAALDESPLQGHPERPPLQLIGDLTRPTFTDHGPRHISILGRASVEAVRDALGAPVDVARFRANVVVDGSEPWDELQWVGRTLRIGAVAFDVERTIDRCIATHANPQSGERDLDILNTLTRTCGQETPTMGVLAIARDGGGEIAIGDGVEVTG